MTSSRACGNASGSCGGRRDDGSSEPECGRNARRRHAGAGIARADSDRVTSREIAQTPASPRPKTAATDQPLNLEPPAAPRTPVRPPSVRERLSADLEQQFAAAMGDASVDEILASGTSPQLVAELELESRQQSRVVRIHGDNVFFSLGGRHEGVASFANSPSHPCWALNWKSS